VERSHPYDWLNRSDAQVPPVDPQVELNPPPASPADGQCWIGSSPTSNRAAQAAQGAQRIGGALAFYAPFVGLVLFDTAALVKQVWNGSA